MQYNNIMIPVIKYSFCAVPRMWSIACRKMVFKIALVVVCLFVSCANAFLTPYVSTFASHVIRASVEGRGDGDGDESINSMTEREVSLRKPMGVILEEDEFDPNAGVIIKRIDPTGQTAAACRSDPSDLDICIRDRIIQVNGIDVANGSLEEIMKTILDGPEITKMVLSRPDDAVVIRWPNGISVAADPGDSFGLIAQNEALVRIPYSCSSGGCGSCEQSILSEDGKVRQNVPHQCP